MDILKKNKILLVHPLGYKVERSGQDVSRIANIMPPLGLASMAAYLKKENIKADIVDYFAKPFSDDIIRDYLTRESPAFIGFSCTTSSFLDGVRIAKMAKKCLAGHKNGFWGPPCLRPENQESWPIFRKLTLPWSVKGNRPWPNLWPATGRSMRRLRSPV